MDYPSDKVVEIFERLGFTHVVWLPDTALGPWEAAIEASDALQLVRVCREGEAWAIAAGLFLGGRSPLVVIQTTGLFESGDAMRNALFDLGLPLLAVVGYRSALNAQSTDSAKTFAEPVLAAWGLDTAVITSADQLPKMAEHFERCRLEGNPGVVLVAEGRM